MTWISAALRIGLFVAVSALLGWYYGYPLTAVTLALAATLLFWLQQMARVQTWLKTPEQPPPPVYGVWDDILSQIYQVQKRGTRDRARLQSTIDRLQDSFASMRDGVAIVDGDGVLKWFNQPAQLLLGLRSADQGQTLVNLVRAPEFLQYFNQGDYVEPLHYHAAGDSGTFLQVEITRFGEGDRLLFIRDVTASMRLENMRKDFVANVSHELRTPLTVISGYLGTFLGDADNLDPRFVKPLQQMLQQAERMENLLKELLWLSRIESEPDTARHEAVDMTALLAELQDEIGVTQADQRLEIDLRLTSTHRVLGDYRELYSAVSNLVQNALKYSPQDSVVRVCWSEQGDGYHLAVTDSGIGIDAGHIPRLTERFYRVEDSRASSTGGSGLGLAIVKHVAATHGLRLSVDSIPGKGSTFSLVFPPETHTQAHSQHKASVA